MSGDCVRIGGLKVRLLESDRRWHTRPLRKSPYYLSLKLNDPGIFNGYRDMLIAHEPSLAPTQICWQDHLALVESLKSGFAFAATDPAVVSGKIIYDGQHRLSAMLFLHGMLARVRWRRERVLQTSRVHFAIVERDAGQSEPTGAFDAHVVLGLSERWRAADFIRRSFGGGLLRTAK